MMKYTTTLSLILLISIFISMCGAAEEEEDPAVLDADGNEVEEGLLYTLVADMYTSGYDNLGGLSLDSNCPPNIIQNISDKVGLPVVFITLNGLELVVRLSSKLIIDFIGAPTLCDDDEATAWTLEYNGSLDRSEVKGAGKVKKGSYFMLKEDMPSQYRIVYCDTDDDDCQDLVLLEDDTLSSTRRLVVDPSNSPKEDPPFLVSIRATTQEDNLKIRKLSPTLSYPTT